MAIIEPFEQHCIQYENRFEKNRFAYQSELAAIKEFINYKINTIKIKKICRELDSEDRIDSLIAELRGSEVMSPKVSSLTEVIREGSPIYELSPSLFANR